MSATFSPVDRAVVRITSKASDVVMVCDRASAPLACSMTMRLLSAACSRSVIMSTSGRCAPG